MVPVADGIHKAEELIRRAVSGTVPVYHHEVEPPRQKRKEIKVLEEPFTSI